MEFTCLEFFGPLPLSGSDAGLQPRCNLLSLEVYVRRFTFPGAYS